MAVGITSRALVEAGTTDAHSESKRDRLRWGMAIPVIVALTAGLWAGLWYGVKAVIG